jgi:hypothetical protein
MNRLGGTQRDTSPVRLHVAKVKVPLSAVIGAWAARKLGAAIIGAAKHPVRVLVVLMLLWLWRLESEHGPWPILTVAALLGVVALVWWRRGPDSFRRQVVWRVRGVWRSAGCTGTTGSPRWSLPVSRSRWAIRNICR